MTVLLDTYGWNPTNYLKMRFFRPGSAVAVSESEAV